MKANYVASIQLKVNCAAACVWPFRPSMQARETISRLGRVRHRAKDSYKTLRSIGRSIMTDGKTILLYDLILSGQPVLLYANEVFVDWITPWLPVEFLSRN